MAIRFAELVGRFSDNVGYDVERVRDQARPVLQEAMRGECRLVMRTAEEAESLLPGARVPVELAPGHPVNVGQVTLSDSAKVANLLGRFRDSLRDVARGLGGLEQLRGELANIAIGDRPALVDRGALESVQQWATTLLAILDENDPLKVVLAIRDDFLGVYEYDVADAPRDGAFPNRAKIKLYYQVIGLVAEWMGCGVEDLTVVVLAHELAHAYTQLGADIDGNRWPARNFALAEHELKEGLAQYYTLRTLRRVQGRYPGASAVFAAMLPYQPQAYRVHQDWVDRYSPEAVRRAMLEVRRWNEGTLAEFNRRLDVARREMDRG